MILAVVLSLMLVLRAQAYTLESPELIDSTLGELAAWMVNQSQEDAPESWLGQYARSWAQQSQAGTLDEAVLLSRAQQVLVLLGLVVTALTIGSLAGLIAGAGWAGNGLVAALVAADVLLFLVPVSMADQTISLTLSAIFILVLAYIVLPGPITRVQSFVLVLSVIFLGWESGKGLAASLDYQITLPAPAWDYETYPSLDAALNALQVGETQAVIVDRNVVRDLVPPAPLENADPADYAYPELRYLTDFETDQQALGVLPVIPEFPGRLAVVVTVANAGLGSLDVVSSLHIGTVAGEFAEARYLAVARRAQLADLKILNDVNLPHLQNIAEALLQPARRNGPLLLIRILSDAALHTWGEAILGFAFGATLGFALGTLFAHFIPMERGLLPYVVASQTVPILAIAPMVVIWLGAGSLAVAVISAYLTFFPVTINTLRGLRAPHPNTMELMRSYAASRWETMWKVRFPAALPYIFTALKVSATASVVGAIIGELPSSIRDGLGRAILDFSSDYSLVSTPKLWAAILVAASIGMFSFLIVSLVEYLVVGRYARK
ncbi:MAG: ABC transporter permease [Anaerolineae bacterium]|nr:ABC transporter permease [Anaerolineae bacterium]